MSTSEVVVITNQVHKTFSPVPSLCGHSINIEQLPIATLTFCLSYRSYLTRTSTVLPEDCSIEPPSTTLINTQ